MVIALEEDKSIHFDKTTLYLLQPHSRVGCKWLVQVKLARTTILDAKTIDLKLAIGFVEFINWEIDYNGISAWIAIAIEDLEVDVSGR
jgi:hypothetical protein